MNFSITKNGKVLDKSLYTWDEKTRTFSSDEDNLVLNFENIDWCTFEAGSNCTFITGFKCKFRTGFNCTFNTGSSCTFDTESDCIFTTVHNCTFNTGDDCTFDTGLGCTFTMGSCCVFKTDSYCTFNTSHSCTFDTDSSCIFTTDLNCVLVRRDMFEVYDISNVENLTIAPYTIEGYVKDGYYYKDSKKQYKAIIADSILSEIIEHKGNVYKVKNYGAIEITYLVKDGDVYSHGKTLKEAKESLIYKLSNRDTSAYKDYKLDTKVSKKEAIQMYRAITGACEQGTKMFVERLGRAPRNLTVKKIIELTKGQYGNNTFKKFFEEVSK